jgi:uncharacterized protein YbcI
VSVDESELGLRGGELNAALTRAIVRHNAQFTGRGPSRARAFYNGNVLVVMLEGTLTPAEESLVADGKAELVLQTRREVQLTMRPALVRMVEELSGCRVTAFLSDTHLDPNLVSEVFVLDKPIAY